MADASSTEFPKGAFDILFSRFGVMFFDDAAAAFTHMRHALAPGARVAFVCWRDIAKWEHAERFVEANMDWRMDGLSSQDCCYSLGIDVCPRDRKAKPCG